MFLYTGACACARRVCSYVCMGGDGGGGGGVRVMLVLYSTNTIHNEYYNHSLNRHNEAKTFDSAHPLQSPLYRKLNTDGYIMHGLI